MQSQINVENLIDAIIQARKNNLLSKIKRSPRNNPILSDLGDCDRQIVYSVLDWDKRPLHDENLQALFDEGNKQERSVIAELYELGFEVILSQEPVIITGRNGEKLATGRIDGAIKWKSVLFPLEIKFMGENIFNQVTCIDDFQKKPHLRKYMRQLPLYLFGKNQEQGFFLIVNGRGSWKLLPVYLDYGTCEWLLQKLERVNKHIKLKTLPDRITYDPQLCDKCPFSSHCLQDVIRKPAEIIDSQEVVELIDRHEELKPLAAEYDDLHDKVKAAFKDIDKAMIGSRYMIMNLPSERTTYELSKEAEEQINSIKKEFAKKVPMRRMKIEKIEKQQEFKVA